jgi:hypothetical protein
LKIKLKSRHFDSAEVIDAESQEVLNILTEQGFKDAFKNDRSWKRCIHAEGDYFVGDGGLVSPKLVFDQMAEQVPEIMDGSSYYVRKLEFACMWPNQHAFGRRKKKKKARWQI